MGFHPQLRNEFINPFADQLDSIYQAARAIRFVEEIQAVLAAAMPEHLRR